MTSRALDELALGCIAGGPSKEDPATATATPTAASAADDGAAGARDDDGAPAHSPRGAAAVQVAVAGSTMWALVRAPREEFTARCSQFGVGLLSTNPWRPGESAATARLRVLRHHISVEVQCFLNLKQLKACCRALRLPLGGNKPDLGQRLLDLKNSRVPLPGEKPGNGSGTAPVAEWVPNARAVAREIMIACTDSVHRGLGLADANAVGLTLPPAAHPAAGAAATDADELDATNAAIVAATAGVRGVPARHGGFAPPTATWCCSRRPGCTLSGAAITTIACDRCGTLQHCECLGISMPGSSAGARAPYTCAVCIACTLNPFLPAVAAFAAFDALPSFATGEAHAGLLAAALVETKVCHGFPTMTQTQLTFGLTREQKAALDSSGSLLVLRTVPCAAGIRGGSRGHRWPRISQVVLNAVYQSLEGLHVPCRESGADVPLHLPPANLRVGANVVNLRCADERPHVAAVVVVAPVTTEALRAQVLQRAASALARGQQPAAVARAHIARMLSSDGEVQAHGDTVTLSVNCPILGARMQWPVRGHACRHLACFDLNAHLEYRP